MHAADLRGRRVGIPTRGDFGVELRRAMAVSGFAGALSLAGLGLADVELIELDADSKRHRPVRRSGPGLSSSTRCARVRSMPST